MATPPIPPISKALLDWLKGLCPDKCPDPGMTDREIWIAAGKAELIRKLAHEHQQQVLSVLEN